MKTWNCDVFPTILGLLQIKDVVRIVKEYLFVISPTNFPKESDLFPCAPHHLVYVAKSCVPVVSCRDGFIFVSRSRLGHLFLNHTFFPDSVRQRLCCSATGTWNLQGLCEQTAENSSNSNTVCVVWKNTWIYFLEIYACRKEEYFSNQGSRLVNSVFDLGCLCAN